MQLRSLTLLVGFILTCPVIAQDWATEVYNLKQHINQLRNTVLEQELKLNAQQRELQLLRGDNEVLTHRIEQLTQQQQIAMTELQQQLQQLQARMPALPASVATPLTSPTTPANPPVQSAPPTPVARLNPPATTQMSERQAYDAAFKLLEARQYQAAILGFEQVINNYGNGKYADNAQYWIAESHYALKAYAQSLGEFNRLLQQYPNSDKRSHAELKMGYVYYELQDFVAARVMLEQVKANYPNSAVAQLAEQKLQKLPSHF